MKFVIIIGITLVCALAGFIGASEPAGKGEISSFRVDLFIRGKGDDSVVLSENGVSKSGVSEVRAAFDKIKEKIFRSHFGSVVYNPKIALQVERDIIGEIFESRKKLNRQTLFVNRYDVDLEASCAIIYLEGGERIFFEDQPFSVEGIINRLKISQFKQVVFYDDGGNIATELKSRFQKFDIKIIRAEVEPNFKKPFNPTEEGFVLPE